MSQDSTGAVFQGGLPKSATAYGARANGLLLRGVVLRSYTYDQNGAPLTPNPGIAPASVYCDVLVYTSIPGARFAAFSRCLVSQERAGLHDGDIWIPRSTSMDISGKPLNVNTTTNPANMDGDHVLIGFFDNDLAQPVILRQIAHPRTDVGDALPETINAPGQRMRILDDDGSPRLSRHNGVFWGVDGAGDFLIDTTRATDGTLLPDGTEVTPTLDGSNGSVRIRLPVNSTARIEIVQDPLNPTDPSGPLVRLSVEKDKLTVRFANGETLNIASSGAGSTLTLGDGAVHVAIVEHLRTLYEALKAKIDAFDAAYALHTHTYAFGPTLPPSPAPPVLVTAPPWDTTIASTKVSLPDG